MLTTIFGSCYWKGQYQMNTQNSSFSGFPADNTTSLSDILSNTYALQDFYDYFGTISTHERIMYASNRDDVPISITDVDKTFPIECIRQGGEISYYSVYKVSEGGYFYIFWNSSANLANDFDLLQQAKSATVYFTAYLPSLKEFSNFVSIKEGISTAEDVAVIDPALELSFSSSSGIRSFSLMSDGTVLEVQYKRGTVVGSRKDLVVESMNLISKEPARSASYLASIAPDDLPK